MVIDKPAGLLAERNAPRIMTMRCSTRFSGPRDSGGERGSLCIVSTLARAASCWWLRAITADSAAVLSGYFDKRASRNSTPALCVETPGEGAYELALGRDPAHPRFCQLLGGKGVTHQYKTLAPGRFLLP